MAYITMTKFLLVVGTLFISAHPVLPGSFSGVFITRKESPVLSNGSKLSLPQIPVPQSPKFSVPSPLSSSSSSDNQQQLQPLSHESFTQNPQIHNIGYPSPSSQLEEHADFPDAHQEEEFDDEYETDNLQVNKLGSFNKFPPSIVHDRDKNVLALPIVPIPPMVGSAVPSISFSNGHPVLLADNGKNDIKNETEKNVNSPTSPEKYQEDDLPMPAHVMQILQALGSGGSIAQAAKPEKEGSKTAGNGFTTANAIGYATGENATVTASVSNKMELNSQTVVITESASASASSMSNGTAFSQATLSSNGWASQFGGGPDRDKGKGKNPPKKGKPYYSYDK